MLNYRDILINGVALDRRTKLNLVGVIGADNSGEGRTDITVDAIGTAFLTSNLPTGVDGQIIVASGRDAFGDGGGGLVVFDESSTSTHDGATVWQVGGLPGRWERVWDGKSYDARWFGARTDLTVASATNLITANTAAIQACVDAAAAIAGSGGVVLPAGNYITNATIHIYRNNARCGIVFRGEGQRFNAENGFAGTAIVCIHSDQPAINVQGARATVIRDLTLVGVSTWVVDEALTDTSTVDTDESEWNDTTLAANANSRYAPYAGITVDGWSGTQPGTHYPTSLVSYGQLTSSDVLIENVEVRQFNTAIAIQPCNYDANGDFVVVKHCNIIYCKWGISAGNSQCRQLGIYDTKFTALWACFTSNTHGLQLGKFNGTISNCSYGFVMNLFQFGTSAYFGPLKMINCYAESLYRFGDIGSTSNGESAIEFDHCQFNFDLQTAARGIPANVIEGGSQPINVSFRGCTFGVYPSVLPFKISNVKFDGCTTISTSRAVNAGKEYLASFHNATCNGIVFDLLKSDEDNRVKFSQLNLDASPFANLQNVIAGPRFRAATRQTCAPLWVPSVCATNAPREEVNFPISTFPYAKSSLSSCTLTQDASKPGELTLVFTSMSASTAARGFEPGDMIYDDQTGMTFAIRAREQVGGVGDYRRVVAEAQNNYKLSGGVYTTHEAFSTTVGTLYFQCCRHYTPSYPVLADITSGSAVLAAVGNDEGTYIDEFVDGDRVLVDVYGDQWVAPGNAAISSHNSGASTITLAGNAARTLSRKRIPIWIRKPPANEASR